MNLHEERQRLRQEIESIEQLLRLNSLFEHQQIDKFEQPAKLRELRDFLRNLTTFYDP